MSPPMKIDQKSVTRRTEHFGLKGKYLYLNWFNKTVVFRYEK